MPSADEKAQRARIRRTLTKFLVPIRKQEDSVVGCLLVLGAYPALVLIVRIAFETSLVGSLLWAIGAWLFPLAAFGYYIDIAEKRVRTQAYERFEMTYASENARRDLAIVVLHDIARDSAHTQSDAASKLLTELGEDQPSAPAAEVQLDEELKEAASKSEKDLPPLEWKERRNPNAASSKAPRRRRYDHIPLEPEDRDDSE